MALLAWWAGVRAICADSHCIFIHSWCACIHMCVLVHVEAKDWHQICSPSHFPLDFSRQSCNKPGAHQFSSPGWLESQRILLSTFTSPRLQVFAATSSFLHRCWGSELKTSCRHSKYFTNWAIFLASFIYLFIVILWGLFWFILLFVCYFTFLCFDLCIFEIVFWNMAKIGLELTM